MAKGDIYSREVIPASPVLHTDNLPENQPKGSCRFILNGVNEAREGLQGNVTTEMSNYATTSFPAGFLPIGDVYMEDDIAAVILVSDTKQQIGLITKDNLYEPVVDTTVLGMDIAHQADITYRLRRGGERVIYWVDGKNKIRTFNFKKEYNFYNADYQFYIRAGGNPDAYVGEKWDVSSFELVKTHSMMPEFEDVQILETGNVLPGSYNFAIQLVDADHNPTEFITTTNTVNIYNESTNVSFERIRGSRNVQSDTQNFPRTNKAIKLILRNLDTEFPFYRIAIIRAAGNSGEPEKVLLSDLVSTAEPNFLYSGNDAELTEIALEDIVVDKNIIYAAKHIEQLENRLVIANGEGKNIDWCPFQAFASKITSDLVLKPVILNNINSDPNVKQARSTFMYRGYMPGEVYSFGITYLFSDMSLSPSFHITGKHTSDTISKMQYHELSSDYLDIHSCSANGYWGNDATGNPLVGNKVRHHRFPFRHTDPAYKLVNTTSGTTTITRYKLMVKLTLAPGKTYPTAGTPAAPILIPYTFRYQPVGSGSSISVNGNLSIGDMGIYLLLYDSSTPLVVIDAPEYGELDPSCILATNYMVAGDERFVMDFDYLPYTASSTVNTDTSNIFGISFSNIEKPHPDVIGFYIVRNERTQDDRMILDNAVFGPMLQSGDYKSFGLIMPKKEYDPDNCLIATEPSPKPVEFYNKGAWFFNPEFQYLNNKAEFDEVVVEGAYKQDGFVNMPTISNDTNANPLECNVPGFSRGLKIQDVQAGTSYNPAIHQNKDASDDGFDLLVGYRNTNVKFSASTFTFPAKDRILYLNAASYKPHNTDIIYNVSVDNKMGFLLTQSTFDTHVFNSVSNTNDLIYGAMVKHNDTAYSNFMYRDYFKEHNNPVLFNNQTVINGFEVYNGDAQISAMHLISSVFYAIWMANIPKKNKIWKIVVGVILVAAAVAATIISFGAAGAVAVPLAIALSGASAAALTLGISLATAGFKFEQMKSMIDNDYEKGLRDTIEDGGVYETIRDNLDREDDTIRWFADRVSNIYMESAVPFGLRSGLTNGIPDFMDAPVQYNEQMFRSYLTEKLTILDREQGSGRAYKGYASAEVYDMNRDYMRFNKEKIYHHLPIEYDCCDKQSEVFQDRVWWSEQSFQEELVDNFRVFLPNNYKDIEGEHGEITDLYRLGNALFVHSREALWQLPQNIQERATNEIISFIGTGDFFSIPPRKVVDDKMGSAGTQHKWATVKTKYGVISLSEIEGKIILHGEAVKELSLDGMRAFFEENLKSNLATQLYQKFKIELLHQNNPANPNGTGYHAAFDSRFERVLITKRDYALLPEKLELLTTYIDYIPTSGGLVYSTKTGLFYDGGVVIPLTDGNYFEDKSFTISYSFHGQSWVSFHSYIPNHYITTQNNLYSFTASSPNLWKHHKIGSILSFYNKSHPFIVEIVKNTNPLVTAVSEDILIKTHAHRWDEALRQHQEERLVTFNKMIAYNNYQSSGEQLLMPRESMAAISWYDNQTVNKAGEVTISRRERDWMLNELRDYVKDYSKPLFDSSWNSVKGKYFTDKEVNASIIGFDKPWYELQSFRDKYLIIRFKFDNFEDVSLTYSYSLETEQPSIS